MEKYLMNYSSTDSTNNETDPGQNRNIVTTGDWVLSILLLAIPIVNIVAAFVWAFSISTPLSKKNFGKAILILWLVPIVLIVVFWGSFMAMFGAMSSGTLM
jgi:small-conductance mechanosensitive channel